MLLTLRVAEKKKKEKKKKRIIALSKGTDLLLETGTLT
jgi:hypothetical protein